MTLYSTLVYNNTTRKKKKRNEKDSSIQQQADNKHVNKIIINTSTSRQ